MMPVSDTRTALLRWQREGESAASGVVRYPAALPVFAGHFPGRPLVPGVYVLATLAEVAAQALARPLTLRAIERAKWSAPAYPDQDLIVAVGWRPVEGWLRLDGTVTGPTGICATCRLMVHAGAEAG
jgi:hypothetical protein